MDIDVDVGADINTSVRLVALQWQLRSAPGGTEDTIREWTLSEKDRYRKVCITSIDHLI